MNFFPLSFFFFACLAFSTFLLCDVQALAG